MMRTEGRRQGFLDRPMVSIDAFMNNILRQSGLIGPIGNSQNLAIVRDPIVARRVAGLLDASSPTAIRRLIIAIRIGVAIKAHVWRAWSHIFQKSGKIISPFVAHGNSTTAIVAKRAIPTIETTAFRMSPCLKLTAMCLSMCRHALNVCFASKATATSCFSGKEIVTAIGSNRTASATANPSRFAPQVILCAANNHQTNELLSHKINRFHTVSYSTEKGEGE